MSRKPAKKRPAKRDQDALKWSADALEEQRMQAPDVAPDVEQESLPQRGWWSKTRTAGRWALDVFATYVALRGGKR